MKLISCSEPTCRNGANCPSTHKNVDVDTDNVNSVITCDNIDYVGYTIVFHMSNKTTIEWAYRSKKSRDNDYNKIKGYADFGAEIPRLKPLV